jgi:WD40 repeat protein
MLADVKGALGSLPLLQYTLRELWTKCAPHRLLTFSAYEELGKITGTLEKGANGVYAQLSPPEQKTAKRIFIELTQLGEGAPDTRRQLSQQDLVTSLPFESAPVGEVIQKLVAANLVVTDKPKEEQVAIVNIAHEALIQHWGQLGGWLDGNREFIRWKRRLEYQIDEWIRGDRNPDFLLRGIALDETKQWYKKKKSELSQKEQHFIRACSLQRLKKKVYGFAVILILVASFGWFGKEWLDIKIRQEIYAENPGLHETIELIRELPEIEQTLKSFNQMSANHFTNMVLALRNPTSWGGIEEIAKLAGDGAWMSNGSQDIMFLGGSNYFSAHFPMLEKYLMLSKFGLSLADASNELQNYSIDIDDDFRAVTFSPNNKLLGIAVPSHIVRILDIETKQEITRIPHEHEINQIKFDFASQWLATVSNSKHLLQVFNPISGDKIFEHLYDEDINSLAFSPNNKLIAIGSEDKIAQVWEISSGQLLTKMVHEAPIEFIEFDPTGQWLSTRTSDEEVAAWIWDINTGKQVTNLIPKLELKAIAFSPNEEWFVVSGNDNMARVINIDSGNQIAKVIHKSEITFAKFDPNSRALLTASRDGKLKLLEVKSGKELPLTGNKYIIAAMFHQDKWLITLDKDFLVSIFEVETGKEIAQIASENTVRDLGFSPNGKWMVIATANGVAQIWEIDTRQRIVEVKHDAAIVTTAFSQNNRWLATGGHDSTARIWDVNTGDEIIKLSHDGPVNFVIFSDNNQWLATASIDKTVRVWEIATGKEISRLLHEKPASIIAFKENSKRIATASMGWDIIRIWKTETGEETTHIYDLPKLEQRFKSLNQLPLWNRQP